MTKSPIIPYWQRAHIILTSAVVGTIVVGFLYWAQKIFIPVAVAVFLTFLLAPLVTILQRRGLGRAFSTMLVVLLAVLVLAGVGWLVTTEVASLADDVPTYTKNINGKIRSMRQMSEGSVMERLGQMLQDIAGNGKPSRSGSNEGVTNLPTGRMPRFGKPATVMLQPEARPCCRAWRPCFLPRWSRSAAWPSAGVGRVHAPEARTCNRLIRLMGSGRMTVTTNAVDDAGRRISRFLLMQLIINVGFGLALTIGLFVIQVPHAVLWGFLAAMLRWVPYIGTTIMATLLIALCLAFFPGWLQPLLAIGLIAALEVVTANFIEPKVLGQSMGISEVGFLVAAAFWTFLWGPVGLVLSSPLTVCLVVLGKYVPHLEFLDVLLGNEKALDADVSYYQRLLARDQDEATQLVLERAKTSSLEEVYDGILVPALNYLKRDRDDLTDADEQFILRATREIVEDLGERKAAAVVLAADPSPLAKEDDKGSNAALPRKVQILGCPGHDEADRLALEMFRQLLDPTRWDVEVMSIELLSSELVALAAEKTPAVVCIGAMPPGGLAHTRYLQTTADGAPNAKIVVGRWG